MTIQLMWKEDRRVNICSCTNLSIRNQSFWSNIICITYKELLTYKNSVNIIERADNISEA